MKRRFKRRRRRSLGRPPLSEAEILAWADAFHDHWRRWPNNKDGVIDGPLRETWLGVDMALRKGLRGFPGGSSLARLLARHRGVRNQQALPALGISQILAWADAHYRRTVDWPSTKSGPIPGTSGETWLIVDEALRTGRRGLAGGTTLAQLLADQRGVRNLATVPPLSRRQILAWADAHHTRTGSWPLKSSGSISEAPGETWQAVDSALRNGQRSLPGGSSLPRFLAEHRGVRNPRGLPRLSLKQILAWADAHHRRTGAWPKADAGPISGTHGETWLAISEALLVGRRGLVGGSSLARLLADRRGVRNHLALPPLSQQQILAWADAHHNRTGTWPRTTSGPIHDAPGETWTGVQAALEKGLRGLAGGSTLARLLAEHRGVRNLGCLPRLKVRQIVAWAKLHRRHTGTWPNAHSGPVQDSGGETWGGINRALIVGGRGLPGGSSLARLLASHGKSSGTKRRGRGVPPASPLSTPEGDTP